MLKTSAWQDLSHVKRTLLALGAVCLACTSCGGGGGGGGGSSTPAATPPLVTLSTVTIAGTTDVACEVTINDVADDDALVDTNFSVELQMDGSDIEAFSSGENYWGTCMITARDADLLETDIIFDFELRE